MTDYNGRCHCGAIGFTYLSDLPPADWSIRACQCRFCTSHDALSASDPSGKLTFQVTDTEALQRYRFGLRTADFLLCRVCGVYIGAEIDTPAGRFGIINTHALDPQPAALAPAGPISYDGEETAGRVDRRIERWTPVVGTPR